MSKADVDLIVLKLRDVYEFKLNKKGKGKGDSSEPSESEYQADARNYIDEKAIVKSLQDAKCLIRDGRLTWKLVIVGLPDTLLNRLASLGKKEWSHYGATHAALQLGGSLIDWNAGSLVQPRELAGKKTLAAVDMSITNNASVPVNADFYGRLARLMLRWNLTKKYSKTSANCQHFADEVMAEMKVQPRLPAEIGNYLDGLRKSAKRGCPHYVNDKGERVYFKDHADLDKFFVENKDKVEANPGLYKLLKAFDRGYMIQWKSLDYTCDDEAAHLRPLNYKPGGPRHCVFGELTIQ